jgi:hypothetical protein
MPKDCMILFAKINQTTTYKRRKRMIIEWLWNQRGFAFPKTKTKSTSAKIKKVKVNAKRKSTKQK